MSSKQYEAPVAEVITFDDVVLAAIGEAGEVGSSYHAGSVIIYNGNG